MTGSVWTVDRVARLEALWSDPAMTPKKIAGRLGSRTAPCSARPCVWDWSTAGESQRL